MSKTPPNTTDTREHPLAKYVQIPDAARAMGLSERTVRRHAGDPTSPFFQPRGLHMVLVHIDEYADWLRGTGNTR